MNRIRANAVEIDLHVAIGQQSHDAFINRIEEVVAEKVDDANSMQNKIRFNAVKMY